MVLPLHDHILYGPVRSRRLGRSLGVNLLPSGLKVCNMDCAYCPYGWTRGSGRLASRRPGTSQRGWPTPDQVEAAVVSRLASASIGDEMLDRLTIAGHGEPTLHPEFEEIVGRLHALRDRMAPGIRLCILSNSTTATWPDVQRALGTLDERYMKLDAGDAVTYARVNGPGSSINDIVDALGALSTVVVQATFVTDREGRIDNTTQGAVRDWLAALARVQPARVHVSTMAAAPALDHLRPVAAGRLREIAEHVRAAGIPVDVFPPKAN